MYKVEVLWHRCRGCPDCEKAAGLFKVVPTEHGMKATVKGSRKAVISSEELYQPGRDEKPLAELYPGGVSYVQEYHVDVGDGKITVLDLLIKVKEDLDGTLVFRYACRMGLCGACTVKINGKPRLACMTMVADLGSEITVEPITEKVIKDLVVDA
ncbi:MULTISPECIES: 2Fe-2S iron-sulfur cluster-binding protein [Pyrobaculum]|uniref:Iron-sulfur protein, putative n=2 Tax=Pyrobaculum aerophilum TaxID=13773 RepID=Q8ZUN7_PYRAE|nr:2Fe-2S iron-sulfur cluster-binding protein [Pyrobaculum aerophilum]AAL64369.1 iron-sulfur protein, putative [Pyrobaculum aerophilum str. IM2]MCX8136945.1 2Fe-2S iron-sulfur cluster-binding protein [Pyrobaculum aerophilum]